MDTRAAAAALRVIARGFTDLADALDGDGGLSEDDRIVALLEEWGLRGLTREEASALFRRHGFAPQTAGGWARGEWIETRDGLRYASERSRKWLSERRA
ncbi:hypothetical protein GCM10009557_02250 [Virgisporangium ochraceum]|uniref:Uncharacterized protein n=1 Tax=Virgisporangium ochraceum TaxID=65505 RepID=A0A8J4EER0_9ACTN|nr:hypothetical protein [Virgisporangium ochraceum]GIJ72850.1 hypothetical protein Voc01_077670 [Virgisporangium ochraceum]